MNSSGPECSNLTSNPCLFPCCSETRWRLPSIFPRFVPAVADAVLACKPVKLTGRRRRHDWRPTISDEARLYTDEEVAMILREAAQSADSPAGTRTSSSGLSLEQIKAAAAEAGLDPVLVERAALRISQRSSESFFARVAGGPLRHRETIRVPTALSAE